MKVEVLTQVRELLRETFEGGLPGLGTQYLDHESGFIPTLSRLTAEQVSKSSGGRPTIAAHIRHCAFHLRVSYEWIQGDHSRRDWLGSFAPQQVTDAEWKALLSELQRAREEFLRVLEGLPEAKFIEEGCGMGEIAHLAYHLGVIRHLIHSV